MEGIDSVRKLLNSNTLKQRREGLKLLDTLLDSPVILNQLDANTAKLWPENKLTYSSWPGVVNLYLSYVDREVLQHNKQLDSTALKVLRKIFAEADNTDRCVPGTRNLLRIASFVFDKIKHILASAEQPGDGLATPLGKEWVNILQKALLPHQQYCQRSNVGAFQGIIEEVMCRFETLQRKIADSRSASEAQAAAATAAGRLAAAAAAVKGRSSEVLAADQEIHSMCGLLMGLLGGVPGQLNEQFAADTVAFCVQGIQWFGQARKFGKPELQLLSCLNGLLLTYGQEMRPVVGPSCYAHLTGYTKAAWVERNSKLKESVLCFCRVCLCLGGPQYVGPKAIEELLQLVTRDIQADAFTWDLQGNKQHQLLAALAASLYYHQIKHTAAAAAAASGTMSSEGATSSTAAGSNASDPATAAASGGTRRRRSGSTAAPAADGEGSGDDLSSDEEQLPRKRVRMMEPDQQLLLLLERQPDRWGPVVALLLHQHGPLLPVSLHTAALQQLSSSTKQLIKDLTTNSSRTTAAAAVPAAAYRRSATPGPAATAAAAVSAAAAAKQQQLQELQLSWTLRCLTELAVCWPAALHPAVAASSSNGSSSARAAANSSQAASQQAAANHASAAAAAVATLAAATAAAAAWQQVWDSTLSLISPAAAAAAVDQDEQQRWEKLLNGLTEPLSWLMHVMVARYLIKLPSRTAALGQLLPLLLQQQLLPQQQQHDQDADLWEKQQQQHDVQYLPLSDPQLALLITVIAGEKISSQSEAKIRQQLLLACLATAETYCSSSSRLNVAFGPRSSSTGIPDRAIPTAAAAAMHLGSTAAAAGSSLPDLLLPAVLVLLESPGLPTPGLNGAPGAHEIGSGLNPGSNTAAGSDLASLLNPGKRVIGDLNRNTVTFQLGAGCNIIWYNTNSWWGIDPRVEVLFQGLDNSMEYLQRKIAATQLQQVLAAAAAASSAAVLDLPSSAAGSSSSSSGSSSAAAAVGDGSWNCWCGLADWTAERLSETLTAALPEDDQDQQHQQHDPPGSSSTKFQYSDPNRQLCHLLLLINIAANLPCLAAVKCAQLQIAQQQQQQQQQQQRGVWCGVGFSGLPGLHIQLQQLMIQGLAQCGSLLREHLKEYPCTPGTPWISQLQHLGSSLARLQRLTDTMTQQQQPLPAAAAGADQQQQQAASSQQIALAVAAGVLQPVVLALQKVVSDAAAAAVAAASDPQFKKARTTNTGDIDLDDDFTPAPPRGVSPTVTTYTTGTPAPQGFAGHTGLNPNPDPYGSTQGPGFSTQAGGFSTQNPSMGPPASRPHSGSSGVNPGPPGYILLMTGGLAGFSGRTSGSPGFSILTPAMAGFYPCGSLSNPDQDICGSNPASGQGLPPFRQGFAMGGLDEGLAGLGGPQGVGLSVLAAVSPACGPDAAQGLLQLWRHVSGVSGGAPAESLLEGLVETMTAAVCAGGWLQLGQLFGMIQGDHTLLSPSKVPLSTLHLLLRLIQAVAVAAAAAGVDLSVSRRGFMSAMSQGSAGGVESMEVIGVKQGSLLSELLEIFDAVHTRLEKYRTAGDPVIGHNPLPQATQLQLGLTILSLLLLLPQHAYGSSTAAAAAAAAAPARAASTPDAYALSGSLDDAAGNNLTTDTSSSISNKIDAYRTGLLDLLDCSCYNLRLRSGPLIAQIVAGSAAAAVQSCSSITTAVKIAIVDISRHLQLQTLNRLTEDQQIWLDLIRSRPDSDEDTRARLDAIRATKNMMLRWETAVAQVADLAAATPLAAAAAVRHQEPPNTLDAQLLLLLLGHAAVTQQLPAELLPTCTPSYDLDCRSCCLDLAAAAADLMAAQQQYSDRFGYLNYHAAAFLWQWFGSGKHTFEQLTLLQPLLCPNPITTPAAAAAAVLDRYGSDITVALMHNIDDDNQLAAAAAGLELPVLLDDHKIDLFGTLVSANMYLSLRPRVARVAEKAGKTPRTNIASRLVLLDRYFRLSLPAIINPAAATDVQQQHDQWAAAAEKRDLAALYYPQPVAKQASMAFAEALSQDEIKRGDLSSTDSWFVKAHLRPRGLQRLLLQMHRNITAVAHPAHKLQRLGQIEVLLHLLQPAEITTPAVARYLITILLQHVQIPALQPACCDFMEIIFQQIYHAAAAAADTPAGGKSSSKAAAAAAAAAAQQRQQLAAAVLEELLPATVAALVQCVEAAAAAVQQQQRQILWSNPSRIAPISSPGSYLVGSGALDLPSDTPSANLLLFLLRNLPQMLLPVISTLDLLPPLPVLAAAAAIQQQQQQELKLPQRIVMLADRVGSMALSSRQRSIQAIRHQLQHSSDQLYAVAASSATAGSPFNSSSSAAGQQQQQRKQVDPAVTAAAYKLARIGAESGDRIVTALAAQILAISGPLDPDIITFNAAAASNSSSSSSSSSSSTDLPMISALHLLGECMFDSQPHVVDVAQTTITHLLTTDDGKAALQLLLPGPKGSAAAAAGRPLLFSYLQIFTDEANLGQDKKQQQQQQQSDPQAAAAALAAAATADLWSPAGKPYDSWLCSLCSTLLAACGAADGAAHSQSLRLLAAAAALRPQLAELLLPHALLLLSSSDGSGSDIPGAGSSGLAARLGAAITRGLNLGLERSGRSRLQSDRNLGQIDCSDLTYKDSDPAADSSSTSSTADTRCLSTMLACLEHNRRVYRTAMMALSNPQQEPQAPTTWHRCYCLHIDYLAVAAAAMACKAYFTALIYIEFWCEEQYGRLSYNPNNINNISSDGSTSSSFSKLLSLVQGSDHTAAAAAAGSVQQQRQVLEDLLLDLYSNVNEPDGIYAVAAAFSSSACQLQLLRHEQQWDKVLGAEDAMLQTAAVQQQQQSTTASSTGVLSALQLLGCQATARQCLNAALNTSSSSDQQQQQQQQLLDMQYELAWRLSDWGLGNDLILDPAGSSSSSAGSYNRQISADVSRSLADGLSGGSSSSRFNACVLNALEAMQSRDQETFSSNVSVAQHDCIMQLARSSTQSAAAVNPILVQLRMCHMLQMGMEAASSAAAAAGGVLAAEQLLQKLLGSDHTSNGRSAAAGQLGMTRYHLSDQIQSVQAAISKVLRRPDALALTLQAQASTARQSGQINFASAALKQLQQLLHAAAAAARPGSARILPGKQQQQQQQQQQSPEWLISMTSPDADWVLESVRLKWLQGQQLSAFRELQGLITALQQQQQQSSSSDQSSKVRSRSVATALMLAQAQAGEWMAIGQFSNSSADALTLFQGAAAIAQQQQQSAVKQYFNSSDQIADLHCQVFFQLAIYADQRFREIELQMASPEWQKQLKVLESKRAMLAQLEALEPALRRQYHAKVNVKSASAAQVVAQYKETLGRLNHTRRTVASDADVVEQRTGQRTQCLKLALANYRACIAAGNSHDLQVVYRLCSLWFKHWTDPDVNAELALVFDSVPSAKFVPLVYQIASRLDTSSNNFQAVLNTALTRLCSDHPYHTLYSLIALKNGSHGKQTGTGVVVEHETDMSKVAAATALLESLKAAQHGRLKDIVNDMNDQVQVFIDIHSIMANIPRDNRGCVSVANCPMPAQYRRKLQDFKHAPPICLTLDIDPTCKYEDVPHVVSVDNTIDFCGGINSPMVIKTVDSTGRRQRQLAKSGNDDLRQDAVMQQFFGLVNALLASSPASRQRRLGIRTYRVVPCSPTTGVLEWVEGTKPMTDYLAEGRQREGGAIAVYRKPGNLTWYDCYMELQKVWNSKQPHLLKDKFLEVCAHFPPVFHNFFLESFPDPARWFEARTLYTRSTAANSMAGYVVGLGDRHMGNMLLDMGTAEVVHIDLGIAFEQGMFLNTAERVPFRLTANLVDGMGAAGVEGPFRRCCQTTLEVLRSHKEALLTVVEVVLHDPLYKWQMTTVKAQRKQQDPLVATGAAAAGSSNSGSGAAGGGSSGRLGPSSTAIDEIGNADAERAVLRVKQKLEGQDVEGGAALSVAAQVGVLLAAAQDPNNLCRMFLGWAAFM